MLHVIDSWLNAKHRLKSKQRTREEPRWSVASVKSSGRKRDVLRD